MKKKISMMLVLCVLLAGCSDNSQSDSRHEDNTSETLSDNTSTFSNDISNESLIRDSENVKFKYANTKNEQNAVGVYGYTKAETSKENFLNLFSGQPKCEEETIPNGFREEYALGDESGVIMERNENLSVQYNTSQGESYFSVEYDAQFPDERTEFNFISREEISDKLASTIHELLEINIQTKIDAVTAERFSKDVEAHIKAIAELDDNPPTADKYGTPADFYLVTFVQTIENIPVNGTYGHAIFTADGMEFMDVFNTVNVSEKETVSDAFINLDGAEKLLKAKYDLLFLNEPVEVESGELIYIINDGKLTPAWEFTFADGIIEYYDAYTGKEIVVNTGEGA